MKYFVYWVILGLCLTEWISLQIQPIMFIIHMYAFFIHLAVILMRLPFHRDNGVEWKSTLTGFLSSANPNVALVAEFHGKCAAFLIPIEESYKSLQILEIL